MNDRSTIIEPHGGYRSLKAYQTAKKYRYPLIINIYLPWRAAVKVHSEHNKTAWKTKKGILAMADPGESKLNRVIDFISRLLKQIRSCW